MSAGRLTKKGLSFSAAISIVLSGVLLVPLAIDRTPAEASGAEVDKAIALNGSVLRTVDIDGDTFESAIGGVRKLTISAWAKVDVGTTYSGNDVIFRPSRANRSVLYLDDGDLKFHPYGSSSPVDLNFSPEPGAWHHFAFVYDYELGSNPRYRIYIDGQENIISSTAALGAQYIYFGGNPSAVDLFPGELDEIEVWLAALNQSEIQSTMHSYGDGTGVGEDGVNDSTLYSYWDFNDGDLSAEKGSSLVFDHNSSNSSYSNVAIETTSGGDNFITFPRSYITSQGGWTAPYTLTGVEALVIAGGGGGGAHVGGGGGAGGFVEDSDVSVTGGSPIEVKVGQGGRGAKAIRDGSFVYTNATNGQDSGFGDVSATGGGRGASWTEAPIIGGSGGGGGSGSGALGTASQGFAGGNAIYGGSPYRYAPGGGGGAGSAGSVGTSTASGAGGSGKASDITGVSVTYAGGGGGGGHGSTDSTAALGGSGGGGDGAKASSSLQPSQNAEPNTGSGGGGGGNPSDVNSFGGFGGSGIVFLRYQTPAAPSQVQGVTVDTRYVDEGTGADSATVRWTALTGQSPAVSSYTVKYSTESDLSSSTSVTGQTGTSATITGLTDGETYYFQVIAVNEVGNGTASSTVASRAVSKDDYALDIGGSALVSAENTAVIPTSSSADFSVGFWFKANNTSGGQMLLSQGDAAPYYVKLGGGNLGVQWNSTEIDTGFDVTAGEWVHFAHTVDVSDSSTGSKIYINGSLISQSSGSRSGYHLDGADHGLHIGSYSKNGIENFDGQIDQVKIWSDVLSASEVADSMHTWQADPDNDGTDEIDNLISHYDFNDNTQATVLRDMASDNDLSIASATTTDFTSLVERPSRTGYEVYKFTRSYLTAAGGFTAPSGVTNADVLVVAGGGAGGSRHGGGGGAGGLAHGSLASLPSTIPVEVGMGGVGANATEPDSGCLPAKSTSGQPSKLGNIEVDGGGRGGTGCNGEGAEAGGSSGGLPSSVGVALAPSSKPTVSGITFLGNAGGEGISNPTNAWAGGGGGGAGAVGGHAAVVVSLNNAGAGGKGYASSILGSTYCFAAGGGGGVGASGGEAGPVTDCDGGTTSTAGAGTKAPTPAAASAQPNSGSGGGGSGYDGNSNGASGSGGSGVVILAAPIGYTLTLDNEGTTSTQSLDYQETPTNPALTKTGHKLVGWSDEDDLSAEYAADLSDYTMPAANDTVYAVWAAAYLDLDASRSGTGANTWIDISTGSSPAAVGSFPTYVDAASDYFSFSGTRAIQSASNLTNPQAFTIEILFRTEPDAGPQKLVGFESTPGDNPSSYDRHLYVDSDGKLRFGVYPGAIRTIASTPLVNDGNWHYAVVAYGSNESVFYLNGNSVGTLAAGAENYSGRWAVGTPKLDSWDSIGTPTRFSGDISLVRIYDAKLDASSFSRPSQNFSVTWDANGGTLAGGEAATFSTNGTIAEPSDPNRTGFNFLGWSTSETSNNGDSGNEITSWPYSPGVNTDVTLYAIWEASIAITTPTTGLSGTFDDAYSLNISASGGTGGNTFTATGLGSGLSINSSTGVISGTPTSSGNLTVTVTVTDSATNSATTSNFTIAIAQKTIANSSAPTVSAPSGQLKQIFASWDAVANASSYTVKIYNANDELQETITLISGTSTTITVSQFGAIADDTEYKVSVQAIGTGNYVSNAESAKSAAVRTNKTYTVTFNAGDNGTGANQTDTKVTGATLVLPDSDTANGWFTRTGYSVSGFATNSDGTGTSYAFGSNYTADADDDLFAVWEAIVFEASGDTFVNPGNPSTVFGNNSVILMKNAGPTSSFTRVGYIEFNYDPNFVWDGAALELAVAGNNGGNSPIGYNTTFTTFNVDVYAFNDASWDESTMDFDVVNATNQAWGLDNSNPFVPDGGTKIGTIGIPTLGSTVGQTFSISNSLLDTFLNDDADGNVTFYIQRSDTDPQANLSFASKENSTYHGPRLVVASAGYEYRISYDINGGSGTLPSSGVFTQGGSAYSIEVTTGITPPTGKRIVGWNTQADGNGTDYAAGDSYNTEESLTLYAKYADSSFAITFNAGDNGTGSEQTLTKNFGTNLTLPNSATANGWFTRAGYTLTSWSENADGSTSDFALGAAYSTESADTFYPVWTINSYTLTLDNEGDTSVTQTVEYLANPTDPAITRTGYTLDGWSDEDDSTAEYAADLSDYTMPAENDTLFAVWTAEVYTVTFSAGTGTGSSEFSTFDYTYDTPGFTLPRVGLMQKTGHDFVGWSTDGNTPAISGVYAPSADVTLIAIWEPADFTVTYDIGTADSGSPSKSSETYTYNTAGGLTLATQGSMVKAGHTFGGWTTTNGDDSTLKSSGFNPSSSVVLYALWEAVDYSVTYQGTSKTAGNPPTDNTDYNIGDSVIVKANTGNLVRTHFTLVGWEVVGGDGTVYGSGDTVTVATANIVFAPVWEANVYTVSYQANGASGSAPSPNDFTYDSNSNIALPGKGSMNKTGYDFTGWSTLATGIGQTGNITPTADVTYFAIWELSDVDVDYDFGTVNEINILTKPTDPAANANQYGDSFTLDSTIDATVTVGADEFKFLGWKSSVDNSVYEKGTSLTLVQDVTFTAQWVELLEVRYALNGGSGILTFDSECDEVGSPSYKCADGDQITLSNAPNRSGYTFAGWDDLAGINHNAGGLLTVGATNYLLFAQWTPIDYTYTFDVDGGPVNRSDITGVNIGDLVQLPTAPGTKTGYDFVGWNDGTNTFGAGTNYTATNSGVDFTAIWEPKDYILSFDWNGGAASAITPITYTVGTTAVSLPSGTSAVRDGYEFAGWSESSSGTAVADPYTPTQARTLYAVWADDEFTIQFNGRGANASISNRGVALGSSTTLPTPSRDGFVFEGWYSDSNFTNKVGNAGATFNPSSSGALHAKWEQASLSGINLGALLQLRSGLINRSTSGSFSGTHPKSGTSFDLQIPAGAFPNDDVTVKISVVDDPSRPGSILTEGYAHFSTIVVHWLSGSGDNATVPVAQAGSPLVLTLVNEDITAGSVVLMNIGGVVTEVATATIDGEVEIEFFEDPEFIVAATKPDAPTTVSGVGGNTEVTVSWTAPASNGGASITGYTVTSSGGQTCTTATTSCTVTGLTNGTGYTFTVIATNSVGNSAASSALASVTPALATYVVSYNSNGGNSLGNGSFADGGSIASAPADPIKSGFTFAGWSTTLDDESTEVTFPYAPGVSSNITLYALWTAVQSGGSGGSGGSTPAPNPVIPEPAPVRDPAESKIGFAPSVPSGDGPSASQAGVSFRADAPKESLIADGGSWTIQLKPEQRLSETVTEQLSLRSKVTGKVEVIATGLRANSYLEVWAFSDPVFIGEFETDSFGRITSAIELPANLLPGEHTLQIGTLNSAGTLITVNIPIIVEGQVTVGTFKGYIAIYTKQLEGQRLSAKVAGKWLVQDSINNFKDFGYSRVVRFTGAGYDILVDIYINRQFFERTTTRTR